MMIISIFIRKKKFPKYNLAKGNKIQYNIMKFQSKILKDQVLAKKEDIKEQRQPHSSRSYFRITHSSHGQKLRSRVINSLRQFKQQSFKFHDKQRFVPLTPLKKIPKSLSLQKKIRDSTTLSALNEFCNNIKERKNNINLSIKLYSTLNCFQHCYLSGKQDLSIQKKLLNFKINHQIDKKIQSLNNTIILNDQFNPEQQSLIKTGTSQKQKRFKWINVKKAVSKKVDPLRKIQLKKRDSSICPWDANDDQKNELSQNINKDLF